MCVLQGILSTILTVFQESNHHFKWCDTGLLEVEETEKVAEILHEKMTEKLC